MVFNARYVFGKIVAVPLLPLMYLQGKRIRASVPRLPEAQEPQGSVDKGNGRALRLLTLGESTVAGVGVQTHAEGFSGTLARELAERLNTSIDWKVYARSGYTAKRVHTKLVDKIPAETWDLIVIGLGGNDAFTLNSPKNWREHLRSLIRALREKYPKTPIVFTNMPPIKEFPAFTPLIKWVVGNLVEILGEQLSQVADEYHAVYYYPRIITLEDWMTRLKVQAEPPDFFSDGVHPSKLTYQVWARDVADFIVQNPQLKDWLTVKR